MLKSAFSAILWGFLLFFSHKMAVQPLYWFYGFSFVLRVLLVQNSIAGDISVNTFVSATLPFSHRMPRLVASAGDCRNWNVSLSYVLTINGLPEKKNYKLHDGGSLFIWNLVRFQTKSPLPQIPVASLVIAFPFLSLKDVISASVIIVMQCNI